MDDDALMQRAAGGDAQAFGLIVQAYQGCLTRFAARLLGDSEAAQDAVQEAFLRLWRLRTHYQPRGCLQAYLIRTIRSVCLDHVRAARPWESLEEGADGDASDPAGLAQRHGLADAVRRAVQSLPEAQRAVFLLSHYEGLSYAEIADALECPIGTVASRKHQATETPAAQISRLERPLMTCAGLQIHLTALLDGEMAPEAAAEAERHLAACPECAQMQADLTAVREMADAWAVDAPDISDRVMQAITFDDRSALLDEMRRLRTEMQGLRAEVAALRSQLLRRADPPLWTPPARPDYPQWRMTRGTQLAPSRNGGTQGLRSAPGRRSPARLPGGRHPRHGPRAHSRFGSCQRP